MRLSEARLKEIIRQEVERRLMEAIVDDLILEEVKKMGLNEDDWQKAKKAHTRRKVLQMLAAAGVLGLGAAWIDSHLESAAAERRAEYSQYYDIGDAQEAAKKALGDYEGPSLAEQEEYYQNIDFAGAIENVNSLPEGSIGAELVNFRVAGLPDLYVSPDALLEQPIPKMKANTGADALQYYQTKYDAIDDKPRALMSLYRELVVIGQLGSAGAQSATIVVNAGNQRVRVLPPEWSILFDFITTAADSLSENQLLEFQNEIYNTELTRFYNTVERGKQAALDKGYLMGTRALDANLTDFTPEQYRQEYRQDAEANYGKHFFDIGFNAGVAGEEKPELP